MFSVSVSCDFLQTQLIYQGTTPRYLPKDVNFPIDFNVAFTLNHWSNDEKAKQLFEKVIFPYLKKKKWDLCLPDEKKISWYKTASVDKPLQI